MKKVSEVNGRDNLPKRIKAEFQRCVVAERKCAIPSKWSELSLKGALQRSESAQPSTEGLGFESQGKITEIFYRMRSCRSVGVEFRGSTGCMSR